MYKNERKVMNGNVDGKRGKLKDRIIFRNNLNMDRCYHYYHEEQAFGIW